MRESQATGQAGRIATVQTLLSSASGKARKRDRSGLSTLFEPKLGGCKPLEKAWVPPRAKGAGGERQWLRAEPEGRGHVAAKCRSC